MAETTRCGYVAIVGRPNVGKSTLLNHILGMKLSITSRKPQTTRHQIMGVKTEPNVQAIYVDTPGIHQRRSTAINKYMNRAAASMLSNDVDVILFVVQALQWTEEDQAVLDKLQTVKTPVVLVINKIDRAKDKDKLIAYTAETAVKYNFAEVAPVSALRGKGIDVVETIVARYLPESDFIYDEEQLTDRSVRFLSAEIIREKLVRELGQELPYTTAVDIEKFEEQPGLITIHALIYVESNGQKSIIIGRKGERLKSIGSSARRDIEKLVDNKVYLNLWVKVREGWSNDERALRGLGYSD